MTVTGAATITSFGTGFNGCRREVRFSSVCTIVYSGNIIIQGGANLVTVAGDVLSVRCVGTGQWIVTGISNIGVRRTGDTMTGALEIGTSTGYQIRTGVIGQSNYFEQGMGVTGPTDPDYFMYNRANGAIWLGTNNLLRGKILASGALEWVSPIQVTTTDPLKVIQWQSVDDAGTSYSSWDHRDGYNVGAYRWRFNGTTRMTLDRLGVLSMSGGVTPGGGRLLSRVTLANTAPGALANGELYLRY